MKDLQTRPSTRPWRIVPPLLGMVLALSPALRDTGMAGEIPALRASRIVFPVYVGTRLDGVVELRNVRKAPQRRAFLSIGVVPKLAAERATLDLRSAAALEAAIRRLPASVRVPPEAFELGGIDLFLREEELHFRMGPVVPLDDGTWSFGSGLMVSGGTTNVVRSAVLHPGVSLSVRLSDGSGNPEPVVFFVSANSHPNSNPNNRPDEPQPNPVRLLADLPLQRLDPARLPNHAAPGPDGRPTGDGGAGVPRRQQPLAGQ